MVIKPQDCIEAIESEIEWCENNRDKGIYTSENKDVNKMCQDAFISGLNQAKILINNLMILR